MHYKNNIYIFIFKLFQHFFFSKVYFFSWRGFHLYIYARTRAAGGVPRVLGTGCSSANWWRIVAGVPRGGRSSSSGCWAWPAGGPRGWLHLCSVSQVGTVCKCAGVGVCKCADAQTFAGDVCKCASRRVQMRRDSRTFANLNVCKLTYKLSVQRLTRSVLTKFVKRWRFVTVCALRRAATNLNGRGVFTEMLQIDQQIGHLLVFRLRELCTNVPISGQLSRITWRLSC